MTTDKDPIVPPFHFIGCLILGILLALLFVDFANAQTLSFKGKCQGIAADSPDYWPCMDKSQGTDEIENRYVFGLLKKAARKQGLKLPRKVVFIDPKCTRARCDYLSYVKGKKLYFSVISGCHTQSVEAGLEALK